MVPTSPTPALPAGRLLRGLAGVGLLGTVATLTPGMELVTAGGALAVAGALFVFYVGLHWVVSRHAARIGQWSGAAVANGPVLAVFVLGGSSGRLGVAAYVGVSLVLAAWRGDGGCEVLALPGLVVGPRTHLACLAFSPIDWLERRLTAPR